MIDQDLWNKCQNAVLVCQKCGSEDVERWIDYVMMFHMVSCRACRYYCSYSREVVYRLTEERYRKALITRMADRAHDDSLSSTQREVLNRLDFADLLGIT